MSYIRFGQSREHSKGGKDLYAYSSLHNICVHENPGAGVSIRHEDWVEVTMRMLHRRTDDQELLNRVHGLLLEEVNSHNRDEEE